MLHEKHFKYLCRGSCPRYDEDSSSERFGGLWCHWVQLKHVEEFSWQIFVGRVVHHSYTRILVWWADTGARPRHDNGQDVRIHHLLRVTPERAAKGELSVWSPMELGPLVLCVLIFHRTRSSRDIGGSTGGDNTETKQTAAMEFSLATSSEVLLIVAGHFVIWARTRCMILLKCSRRFRCNQFYLHFYHRHQLSRRPKRSPRSIPGTRTWAHSRMVVAQDLFKSNLQSL